MKGNVNSRWGRRPASGRRGRHAAKSRLSRLLALFSAVAISGGVMVALAPAASASNGGGDGSEAAPYTDQQSVQICHRNSDDKDPYVINTPNVDGIGNGTSNHSSHTGDPWSAGLKDNHVKWGDIIPAFWWVKNGVKTKFDGQNWTADGQEIYNNGCQIPSASLSLTKSANRTSFSTTGDPITYTFAVTNTGNATVDNLLIDDFFFSGLKPLGTIDCGGRTTLASMASIDCSVTYTATDADVAAGESIRNSARATGTSFGRAVKSNESDAVVTFAGAQDNPKPGYELWKTSEANWGEKTIIYTLHMQRKSSAEVTGAAIDQLPIGVSLVPDSASATKGSITEDPAGTMSWTGVTLSDATVQTATFTVSVSALPDIEIVNIATVPTDNPYGVCRTDALCTTTDTVPRPAPAVAWLIKKSASPTGEVNSGDTITYTLTATNQGEGAVFDAQAVDKLPSGVSVDAASLPDGLEYDSSSHSLTWTFDLGTEAGNSTATVDYEVTVTAGAGATLVNAITQVSAGGQCEPVEDVSEFRNVVSAFTSIDTESDANANCVTTNRTPADSSTSTPPADTDTDTPADTGTPEVQGVSRVEPEAAKPPIVVKGVSQELPPAPVIKVKPAAQVAPAPSANADTGQGQSPWAYLLFGAGALLLLGAWRVRRNGNA